MFGRGGGRVISVLPFYSEDLSSSPTVVKNLAVKLLFEKNDNQQKEAGVGPFKNYSKHNSLPLGSILLAIISVSTEPSVTRLLDYF